MRSAVVMQKNSVLENFGSGEYIKKFGGDRQKNRLTAWPCLKNRQVFSCSLPR